MDSKDRSRKMWKLAKPAMFGFGILLAGAAGAQAQTGYYPGATWQNYPTYTYPYSYSPYAYSPYSYSPYGYPYGSPVDRSYLGYSYPAPLAYWDPYVWYRPYSDNAGPKASGHGGF
jgi:hypothetical protein